MRDLKHKYFYQKRFFGEDHGVNDYTELVMILRANPEYIGWRLIGSAYHRVTLPEVNLCKV